MAIYGTVPSTAPYLYGISRPTSLAASLIARYDAAEAIDGCKQEERDMGLRYFAGGINHETNTFSPIPADAQRFRDMRYDRGQAMLERYRGTKTPFGGFQDAANELGIELVPTIHSFAMPSGAVTRDEFEVQMADTLDDLEGALAGGKLDGVLLGLHGAMVVDGIDDGEGEYIRRVREMVGPDVPIVTEFDLHANISVA